MSILAEYIDQELRDQNIIEEINLNKNRILNDHDMKNLYSWRISLKKKTLSMANSNLNY